MKQRNNSVDLLRGIAILLVVLGHTMSTCTVGAESTVLYNIIWSIQMPLFFLISGYVTGYSSKNISLGQLVWKRTKAYLIPWAIWSFLIRGLIFDQEEFFNIKSLLWNMDSGYWFLASLWMITLIFGIAQFFASKARGIGYWGILISVYLLGAVCLAILGLTMGLSFLCIKLTLYYMPFYAAGALFGAVQDGLNASKLGKRTINTTICVCGFIYSYIILHVNLYEISDGFPYVLIRAAASLAGCILICALCSGIGFRPLVWLGKHSLEIYLIHYLFLGMIKIAPSPSVNTVVGWGMVALNYSVTMAITAMIAYILNQNKWIKNICFGR